MPVNPYESPQADLHQLKKTSNEPDSNSWRLLVILSLQLLLFIGPIISRHTIFVEVKTFLAICHLILFSIALIVGVIYRKLSFILLELLLAMCGATFWWFLMSR